MGWNSTNRNTIAEVKDEIKCDFMGRVLKISNVGNVIYAAVKKQDETGVFAYIGLTRKEGKEIYLKDMDETCGPNESKCPKAILDLLTPTENTYANNWRERCKKFHENKGV